MLEYDDYMDIACEGHCALDDLVGDLMPSIVEEKYRFGQTWSADKWQKVSNQIGSRRDFYGGNAKYEKNDDRREFLEHQRDAREKSLARAQNRRDYASNRDDRRCLRAGAAKFNTWLDYM